MALSSKIQTSTSTHQQYLAFILLHIYDTIRIPSNLYGPFTYSRNDVLRREHLDIQVSIGITIVV